MSELADRFRKLFRVVGLTLLAACGDDGPLGSRPPTTGMSTILITLLTTGSLPDPNGYRVVLDQNISHTVTASETASLTLTVTPGPHTIELTDVAENCLVSGGHSRGVSTSSSGSTGVTFRIHCPRLATLRIRTSISGTSPDLDGYLLSIDGTPKGTIGTQDSVVFDDLQPSSYRVRLSSVVGNCSISGGSSRQIVLGDGGLETVDFVISCVPRLDDLPGETLVISSRSLLDEDYNLYLLRGATRQRLTDNVGDEVIPEFSPTADRILFLQSTTNGRFLRVMERVTRRDTLLPTQRVERAVWSPDGARIAFARGGRIVLINSDGSGEFPLTSGTDDREPYWSPNGARIAFTRSNAVYVVNADGSGLRQISPDMRLSGPWSPDGRSLALTVLSATCTYYYYYCYYSAPAVIPTDLVILDVDTGQELALHQSAGIQKWSPAWSADGQRLYFISAPAGNADLFVVGATGGTPLNLTNSTEQENWVSVGTVPPSGVSASLAGARRR
jgi:hypothetical protein